MVTQDLNTIELYPGWLAYDPSVRWNVTFPFIEGGLNALSVVYITLEPGNSLPAHTDSAEELWLVLEGSVEATIGTERRPLHTGQLAAIPEMVSHELRNIGATTARVVGVLASTAIVSTFEQVVMPEGERVFHLAPMRA